MQIGYYRRAIFNPISSYHIKHHRCESYYYRPHLCWVSFSIPMKAVGATLSVLGIVFDTHDGCGGLLSVLGIVFDTRDGCGGLLSLLGIVFNTCEDYRKFSFQGWVLFSIPMRVEEAILSVLGIVFDTRDGCGGLLSVLGIVFDTHEDCGGLPFRCWVLFSIPMKAVGSYPFGIGYRFRYLVRKWRVCKK